MTQQRGKKSTAGIFLTVLSLACALLFIALCIWIKQPFTLPEGSDEPSGGLGLILAVWTLGYGFLWISPLLLLSGTAFAVGALVTSQERIRKLVSGGCIALNLGLLVCFFLLYGNLWIQLLR